MMAETRGSMLAGKSNRWSMNPTTPITFTQSRSGKVTTTFSPQIPYLVTNCKQRGTDLEGAEVAPRDGLRHKLPQHDSEAEHIRSDDSIPFLVSLGIGGGEAASCSKRVQWNGLHIALGKHGSHLIERSILFMLNYIFLDKISL